MRTVSTVLYNVSVLQCPLCTTKHIRHHAHMIAGGTEFTQVCNNFFVPFVFFGGCFLFRLAKGFRLPVINHSTASTTNISKPSSKLWAKLLHFGMLCIPWGTLCTWEPTMSRQFSDDAQKSRVSSVRCAAQFPRPHCQRRQPLLVIFLHFIFSYTQ